MTTPPPWPASSAPVPPVPTPPAPSGYEATPTLGAPRADDNPFAAPSPERAAGSTSAPVGYLAQTYPAGGYGPAQDEWAPTATAYGTPSPPPPSAGYPQPYPGQGYAGPSGSVAYGGQPYAGQPYAGQPPANLPVPYPFASSASAPWAPPPPNDSMAVAALVVGLVSLFTGLAIGGPVAVGLGIAGLRRTRDGSASGRGMAVAGLVTGALATVGLILAAVMIGIAIWGEL